jgi:hypothetical protein
MRRLDSIPRVIIATCCPHNFIIEVDGFDEEDDNDTTQEYCVKGLENKGKSAKAITDPIIAKHFASNRRTKLVNRTQSVNVARYFYTFLA